MVTHAGAPDAPRARHLGRVQAELPAGLRCRCAGEPLHVFELQRGKRLAQVATRVGGVEREPAQPGAARST